MNAQDVAPGACAFDSTGVHESTIAESAADRARRYPAMHCSRAAWDEPSGRPRTTLRTTTARRIAEATRARIVSPFFMRSTGIRGLTYLDARCTLTPEV